MTEIDCREVVWDDHYGDVPVRVLAEPVSDKAAQVWVVWGPKGMADPLPYSEGGLKESGYFKSAEPDPDSWLDRILYRLFGGPETFEEVLERKIQQAEEFVNQKEQRRNREQVGCTRMKQELKGIHETN